MSLILIATNPSIWATSSALEQAREQYQAGNWQEAVEAYRSALNGGGGEGQDWFQLGHARHQLGEDRAALAAYARAEAMDFSSLPMAGTKAVSLARLGDTKGALTALEEAVELGLPPNVMDSQAAFAAMRESQRFQQLREEARDRTFPCGKQEANRQFDFWVGEWDVYVGERQVGVNRIELQLEQCLIRETYVTQPGAFAGSSVNFYDPALGGWRQIWVDNQGQMIHFEGRLVDDSMVFEGKQVRRDGSTRRVRMRFEPRADGTVRQLIESAQSEGAELQVSFDGEYRRREASDPRSQP